MCEQGPFKGSAYQCLTFQISAVDRATFQSRATIREDAPIFPVFSFDQQGLTPIRWCSPDRMEALKAMTLKLCIQFIGNYLPRDVFCSRC